jgi:hypothetical protein
MGHLTDDELANGAFMHYDVYPPIQSIIVGKAHMPNAWMTAVKDRIRWLSRALEKAKGQAPSGGSYVAPCPAPLDQDLRACAHAALDAAERAWHAYAATCEVGPERTRAFDVFENIRRARHTGA